MGEQATTQVANAAVVSKQVERTALQRTCDCGSHTIGGSECDSCKKDKGSGAGNTLPPAAASGASVGEVPPIVHEVLNSPGQQLDLTTRNFFEPRFGRDFSHVRVHTDIRAAESARAVGALAYTVGRDVIFGSRQYQTGTADGLGLIAHELAHVMQQGRSTATLATKLEIGVPGNSFEREAETAAQRVIAGEPIALSSSHPAPHLQRVSVDDKSGGCGICEAPMESGKRAHLVAHAAFAAANPQIVSETKIFNAQDQENGRLDLADVSETRVDIGELKPDNFRQVKAGYSDLRYYRKMLKKVKQIGEISIVNAEIGSLTIPPPRSPLTFVDPTAKCPAEQALFIEGPFGGEGLYTYRCSPQRNSYPKNCCEGEKEPVPVPDVVPVLAVAAELLKKLSKQQAKGVAKRLIPVTRYASCIVGILLLASGRARAGSEGEDPLEQLVKSASIPPKVEEPATDKPPAGTQGSSSESQPVKIPPEIQAMIDRDPELKQILQDAVKSGNPSAAENELTRKMMEIIAQNKDQFSEEDLKFLLSTTETAAAHGAKVNVTAETLRQMIEAAKKRKGSAKSDAGTSAKGVGTDSTSAHQGVTETNALKPDPPLKSGVQPDPSSSGQEGAGTEASTCEATETKITDPGKSCTEGHPQIDAQALKRLESSPATVRSLFEKFASGQTHQPVTTEVLNKFLAIVPADLTAEELAKLALGVKPAGSLKGAELLARLEKSIRLVRAMPDASLKSTKEKDAADVKLVVRQPDLPETAEASKSTNTTGATEKKSGGTEKTGEKKGSGAGKTGKKSKTDDDVLERIKKRMRAFDWSTLEQGTWRYQFYTGKDPVRAAIYGRSNGVEFSAEVVIKHVTNAKDVSIVIISSSEVVLKDDQVVPGKGLVGRVTHNVIDVKQ